MIVLISALNSTTLCNCSWRQPLSYTTLCTVCTVLSYVHLIILAPFLLRTGPWTAISPAGIQLDYTVASKDKTSCILQKLKTVFVCPRQRWKVTVVLLRSIVGNLQMDLFLFLTSAIMQMCISIRLSVVLSSVSWWCYFYACVSKCLCWIYCGVLFFLVGCSIFSLSKDLTN